MNFGACRWSLNGGSLLGLRAGCAKPADSLPPQRAPRLERYHSRPESLKADHAGERRGHALRNLPLRATAYGARCSPSACPEQGTALVPSWALVDGARRTPERMRVYGGSPLVAR